jgi:hypothetical protein
MPGSALPGGLFLALILAKPVLRAHPERHVLLSGVRVVGKVTVAAGDAEVAAGPLAANVLSRAVQASTAHTTATPTT